MKKFLLLLSSTLLFGLSHTTIKYKGYISKIAYNKTYLIAALEEGKIVIKNFKTLKTNQTISMPKIHDFMGNLIPMPIFSIDISPDKTHILILTEGENGKRELFIYDIISKKLSHIFTSKKTLMKARFITKNTILFGLLSDEVALYDLNKRNWIYQKQIGNYVFSTFAINDKKDKAVIGDESGNVKIVNIKNGKKITTIKGFNKDKTLSLDYKKNFIINASSDMRVAIYNEKGTEKLNLKTNFLPYGAALSPNIKSFAIQYNEKNDIKVFDFNKKLLYTLHGHTMALNGIKYSNENTIISYSPAEIIIWKLKDEK